jgi:S1-C subfamily serine protease
VAGLLAAACGGGDPAALQDIQGTTRQQLIADRNDPAVMLILTEYKATISVPTLGYNDAALQALANQVVAQAQSGQIGSDQKSLYDALVAGISQNPGAYFTSQAPAIQKDVTLDWQCTGSIVTPDGYIVTAAHCTSIPDDERVQGYIDQGLKPVLQAAVQKFLTDNPGFDSDQQQKLSDAVTAYLADQAQLSNETEALAGAMFSSSSSGDRQAVAKPLSLITQGNPPTSSNGPFGDKDVSIVKLNGYSNLPTLPVGSDAGIDTGQQLFVDGYPAAAESGNLDNLGTPTLSSGSVSAKKTSDQGVPLLETTATSSGGNSGGPGFDQNGVMVGIVSYGSSTNGASYNALRHGAERLLPALLQARPARVPAGQGPRSLTSLRRLVHPEVADRDHTGQ